MSGNNGNGSAGNFETIEEARVWLEEHLEEGVSCPLCSQLAKVYKRSIYRAMAVWLVLLCQLYSRSGDWVHTNRVEALRQRRGIQVTFRGGDPAKLRYWGLIREQWNEDETKRTSGLWRPTDKGIQFAQGQIALPRRALIFDGQLRGFDGESRFLRESLGDDFDYQKLWSGTM